MTNLDSFNAYDVRGRIQDEIQRVPRPRHRTRLCGLREAAPPRARLKCLPMESKLARQLQDDLIAAIGRLSPEDRLSAFLAHCRLVTELYEAGRRQRARPSHPAES